MIYHKMILKHSAMILKLKVVRELVQLLYFEYEDGEGLASNY
jgi:hypothetical protein